MDKIVEDLQQRGHSGRSWMSFVRELSKTLHDQLKEEETIVFQIAGKILKYCAEDVAGKEVQQKLPRNAQEACEQAMAAAGE